MGFAMIDLILIAFAAAVFYVGFRMGAKYSKFSVFYAAAKASITNFFDKVL